MSTVIPASELHGALAQAYSDLYKDLHGIRPRWMRFSAMPTEELERRYLELMLEADATDVDSFDESYLKLVEEDFEPPKSPEERWMDAARAAGADGW